MFASLSDRIAGIFEKLRRNGIIKETDIDTTLREIRIALLEADVSLEVAKNFIADIKKIALGQNIIKSISPGQMITKIVHDYLVELLGTSADININHKPYKIMLVGLQGAGKTTTAAKLAKFFTKKKNKVMLASTDVYRPAAIEQLKILSQNINDADFAYPENANPSFQQISKFALEKTNLQKSDILILDTAGRLHIDDMKMNELIEIQQIINANEIWLVVDIMTGQDAFNIAKHFSNTLKISGIILTRTDGDARGGVALSIRAITGCNIKFLCIGEKLDDIEFFDPRKIADRILGMGDIVSLVERAQEHLSKEEAEATANKMQKGIFTFDDLANQMEKMTKLGGLKSIISMLPQSKKLEAIMDSQGISDKTVHKNIAIIRSMTKKERKNYKIINGSRRKRIASGSGTSIQEVNKLIKQYEGTLKMIKQFKNGENIMKIMSKMKD